MPPDLEPQAQMPNSSTVPAQEAGPQEGPLRPEVGRRYAGMQTDAMATGRRAALLSRCFGHWKACFEQKRCSALRPRRDSDANVEALRRRLIQPSDGLVLRMAYCAWRRHFQGLELLRAAHIHYHLTLLFKHWLEWRRRKMMRESRVQLEQQAQLHHDAGLKGRALITWRSAWDKACQAQAHHRYLGSFTQVLPPVPIPS
ncbi:hypothetical protein ANANG_G00226450 [Anguilla anguilla]|uniref:Sfi1 spindle body domain-containing protein n=1 Tax=Anguilla anguilla TaxID=7936 RepID=A0A9D3RQ23_ANGAN|nr:hypothetical protein ANANG_G00226450 [Anguilla anguilla]